MFHCELHRLEGNEQLCSDWRDLLNRVRPDLRLFGPEWFSIWDRTIGSHAPWTGEMHVVAVYDDGSPTPCGAVDSGNLSESSMPQGPGLQQIFNADLQPHANRRLCGVLPIGHPKVGLLRVNAMAGYFQPSSTRNQPNARPTANSHD